MTRDRALLQRKIITHGCFVRATDPREQVAEVLIRLDLHAAVAPFTRCTRCNGLLEKVAKRDVLHLLEPKTKRYYDLFQRCRGCSQVYWQGSHHSRAQRLLEQLVGGLRSHK